jgi:hypothetical protein
LDLADARAASIVGIFNSSGGTCCEVVMQSYMQMEMLVALASVKLSFSQA